jgi:hypothetical protein
MRPRRVPTGAGQAFQARLAANELVIGVNQMQGNFGGMRAQVLKGPCPSISATVAVRG